MIYRELQSEPFKLGSTYQCAEGLNNQGPIQLITMYRSITSITL